MRQESENSLAKPWVSLRTTPPPLRGRRKRNRSQLPLGSWQGCVAPGLT